MAIDILKDSFQPQFELREYQKQVIRDLYSQIRSGKKRVLIYAPTGAGKTAIASKVIYDATTRNRKVLFLIHRDPLLEQTQQALLVYGIEAGIIKAGFPEDRSKQVQIASIQSLARRQFPPDITLVIIDEAHTNSWFQTFDRIKEAYADGFFVGLSASPWRTKCHTEYMGQHFEAIVEAPNPAALIRMGFLVQPRYFGVGGLVDLGKLEIGRDGDYKIEQMQKAYMASGVSQRIVKETARHLGDDRTGIIFCGGVEQSKFICSLFNELNIKCEHLQAETSHSDRREMYARLREGETRVLSSVGTLTEGFDVPTISLVAMARPTRSRALMFQMCGRGLRLAPNKIDCLLLDFGENFQRLGFITTPQKITLEPTPKRTEFVLDSNKECPECHALVHFRIRICPECGYVFPVNKPEDFADVAEEFEAEMGELFPRAEQIKMKFLRKEIRLAYRQRLPIDNVGFHFKRNFGHFPPNGWHLGAVFGTARTDVNRQRWLDYLFEIKPNASQDWIKFHVELEFGKPGQQYKFKNGKTYTPPKTQHFRQTWWGVLGISNIATPDRVKAAYRKLAKKYHPDISDLPPDEAKAKMQLLNWAYEAYEKDNKSRNVRF